MTVASEQPLRPWRRHLLWVGIFVAVTLLGFWGACLLDGPVHKALHNWNHQQKVFTLRREALCRAVGGPSVWIVVVVMMILIDTRGVGKRGLKALIKERGCRGPMVILATVLGLCLSIAGKLLIRRMRPPREGLWEGAYMWRPWGDKTFDAGGLGLPSEEAAVAFAGMFLLCRMYPRATPVFLALAAACAFARVFSRVHFVSDVWAAAALGWATAWLVWNLLPSWRPPADRLA